jgi:hypothetical protein
MRKQLIDVGGVCDICLTCDRVAPCLADLCHHLFRGIRFSRVVDHDVEGVPREGQSDRSADTT